MARQPYRLSRRDMLKVAGVGVLGLAAASTVHQRGFRVLEARAAGSLATATLGTPTVDVTFENIALEIPYTPAAGHDGSDLAATIQYRPWGSSDPWRTALPPQNVWHNPNWDVPNTIWNWDGGLTAFYGSVLSCAADSSWEVLVTVTDGTGAQGTWGNATGGWYLNDTTHAAVLQGTATAITTRAETIPDASTLVPTHYVNASTGSDSNAGTGAGTAWKTLDYVIQRANAASADMVIQFAPGSYQNSERYLTGNGGHQIVLLAENPAVLGNGGANLSPSGSGYSVIEDPTYTVPGQLDGGGNPIWQSHTMTGPNGTVTNCYKASMLSIGTAVGSPGAAYGYTHLAIAKDLLSAPREVSFWDRKAGTATTTDGTKTYSIQSPAAWGEVLNINLIYRYGWACWENDSTDTSTATLNTGYGTDIYLVMPPLTRADGTLSSNPNDFYVNMAFNADTSKHSAELVITGPNVRVYGFVFRLINCTFYSGGNLGVADRNWFCNASPGSYGDQGSGYPGPSSYNHDAVIQDNIVELTNNKTAQSDADHCQPWFFVKQELMLPDSPSGAFTSGWRRLGGLSESTGIGGYGLGRRLIIRRNNVSGGFDGIGTGDNSAYDRYAWYAGDICDNLITYGNDDGFCPAQKEINLRFFRNTMQYQQDCISSSYTNVGPIYIYRNTFWNVGFLEAPAIYDPSIIATYGLTTGDNPITKYGDFIAIQPCLTYMIHNTIWTSDPANAPGGTRATSGWGAQSGSPGSGTGYSQLFYLRNNIYRMTGNTWETEGWVPAYGWDEDYNGFASNYYLRGGADQYGGGMKLGAAGTGGAGSDTVSGYRTLSGGVCGTHSNTLAGFDDAFGSSATVTAMDALFANASGGSLSLATTSPAIDAGVAMPGISGYDLLGGTYLGAAPDLGAIESPYSAPGNAPTPAPSPTATPTMESLTLTTSGSGSVSATPSPGPYAAGTVVTITATPASGWVFSGWAIQGTAAGTNYPQISMAMITDYRVNATFVPAASTPTPTPSPTATPTMESLTLTTSGSGSVSASPSPSPYTAGTVVSITAKPASAWAFTGWKVDGTAAGTANPLSLTMKGNHAVNATFLKKQYTLTLLTSGSGKVAATPAPGPYATGTVVTITATPAKNWTFTGWVIDGTAVGTNYPQLSMAMNGNQTVKAVFR